MEIKKVVVIGAGTMGGGIAQLCAQQGIDVILADVTKDLADKTVSRVAGGLAKRVQKGKITAEEKDGVLSRIVTAGDLSAAGAADIVIESIVEDLGSSIEDLIESCTQKLTAPQGPLLRSRVTEEA